MKLTKKQKAEYAAVAALVLLIGVGVLGKQLGWFPDDKQTQSGFEDEIRKVADEYGGGTSPYNPAPGLDGITAGSTTERGCIGITAKALDLAPPDCTAFRCVVNGIPHDEWVRYDGAWHRPVPGRDFPRCR